MTAEETRAFWELLRTFRDDTLPVQVILVLGMLVSVWLVFRRPGGFTDSFVKAFLALAFLWNGLACFFIYCFRSPTARFLGAPQYLVIGFMFIVDLLAARRISFSPPPGGGKRAASLFLVLLAFLFPFLGIPYGHGLIAWPGFPCPLAGFALFPKGIGNFPRLNSRHMTSISRIQDGGQYSKWREKSTYYLRISS
jgi:hypothetical protein